MSATTATATPVSSFADVAMHHATRAKADKLVHMLAAEYPALTLEANANDADKLESWTVFYKGDIEVLATEDKQVPELADILEACQEVEVDPSAGDEGEDEDRPSGSVVRETYRAKYREVSTTGQSCGDWLAEVLTNLTTTATSGKKTFVVVVEKLDALFRNNGLDLSEKWATNRSAGWIGRYRMNGRQRLERVVLRNGGLYGAETSDFYAAPQEFLDEMRTRHAKAIAKEAKAAAAKAAKAEAEKAVADQEQRPTEA